MKRRVCSVCLIMFCLQVSILHAEEQVSVIQNLIQRVETLSPGARVERETLQEIAVAAYVVLNNVPFLGLQDSQLTIEHIILLKKALLNRPGRLERRLALSLQKNIDCVLLAEVNRRAMSRNGKTVSPPYQEGTVRDDTVTSLLAQNAIAEMEHAQYLLQLSGSFSQYFYRQQFEAADLLSGKAMRRLPSELRTLRTQMYGRINVPVKMDKKTLEDFLVVYTLAVINQARDIRMLWEVFRQENSFYFTGGIEDHWRKIGKVLSQSPYRSDLITREKKRAQMVVSSGTDCCDVPIHSGGYAAQLLFNFLQYFGDMQTIASQHEGIFSWYCQSQDIKLEDVLSLEAGYWLEFDE